MTKSNYLIYKHTSPSGRSYIGQTNNYNRRCNEHQRLAGKCLLFEASIEKHGWDNFIHEILMDNLTKEEANIMEEQLILAHNTIAPFGYNIHKGGLNHSPTLETRIKISNTLSGRPKPPRTKEHCENISISHSGKIRTEKHCAALSVANSNKPKPPRTKEHCENMKKPKAILTCPHCGKIGGGGSMTRWHFSNCKSIKT